MARHSLSKRQDSRQLLAPVSPPVRSTAELSLGPCPDWTETILLGTNTVAMAVIPVTGENLDASERTAAV